MNSSRSYDLVFLGAGCATLSLLVRLARMGYLSDKKVLVYERSPKTLNDRTWCFWEKGEGYFEEVVHHAWDTAGFYSQDYSGDLTLAPYRYKMIRGIDFYQYCMGVLEQYPQVEFRYEEVVATEKVKELAPQIFNSIFDPLQKDPKATHLLQHFKGRVIETEEDFFEPTRATLMDFRVDQGHGTTFAYVLPVAPRRALVEYTLFTEKLLSEAEYDAGLDEYLSKFLRLGPHEVIEEEFGVIPMTGQSFPFYRNGMYHIGTAGGQTKASSGYTFQFIQKRSDQIAEALVNRRSLQSLTQAAARFMFYDRVLLDVLAKGFWPGDRVFSRLFKKNPGQRVFSFLDNESTVADELRLISSLPTWPFMRAAMGVISR
ncbi:MAG: lycopene cyclase family protein [Bacteroidota bacterium]